MKMRDAGSARAKSWANVNDVDPLEASAGRSVSLTGYYEAKKRS